MSLPSWLNTHVSEADLHAIEESIGQAESKTAGEIVPMIVRSSSFTAHVPVSIAFITFAILLLLLPMMPTSWNVSPILVDAGIAAVSLLAAFTLSKVAFVRRLLVPWPDRHLAVAHRASLEFYSTGIPATHSRTGILIFVSLFERRAVILGDQAISDKLKPETWIEITNEMLKKFGEDKMREGMMTAIGKVGAILTREFPAQAHDQNELPNSLIVKE